MKYAAKYRKWSVKGSELIFYFIGVSDVIWRHMATVPQNNDPSVAKGLNVQKISSRNSNTNIFHIFPQFYGMLASSKFDMLT